MTTRATHAWMHRAGIVVDHDALDRIALLIQDGLNAITTPNAAKTAEKVVVLQKLLAMTIAALPDTPDGEDVEKLCLDNIAGALALEVRRFRRAMERDGWTR